MSIILGWWGGPERCNTQQLAKHAPLVTAVYLAGNVEKCLYRSPHDQAGIPSDIGEVTSTCTNSNRRWQTPRVVRFYRDAL